MRILIAEDEPVSRRRLEAALERWGYEAVVTRDGMEAWRAFQEGDPPSLAILDWIMPGMDGIEVCQRVRTASENPAYLILLTTKGLKENIIEGLEAGADDYLTKPFDFEELHARIKVGIRVIHLQTALAARVREVEEALLQVKRLQGLLPICCYCKKIRDDTNYWQQVEHYIADHSEAQFSHGICPECFNRVVKSQLGKLEEGRGRGDQWR